MNTIEVRYDPTDPVSVAARDRVRDVLWRLARARDAAGDCARIESDLFNEEFNDVFRESQRDHIKAGLVLLELVFAADRGAARIAAMHGCSVEAALHQVVP